MMSVCNATSLPKVRPYLLWYLLWLLCGSAFGLNTAYVGFETPDNWKCELAEGVWICQSTMEPDRKESVVLSIATMATEWDSIDNYESYLKQPREIPGDEGDTLPSQVKYVRKRNINGNVWVDSLQFNSELPGFWARYVATVHQTTNVRLAILITYIVSEERYSALSTQFERMVSSLKPNNELNIGSNPSEQWMNPLPGGDVLGKSRDLIAKAVAPRKGKKKWQEPSSGNGTFILIVVTLVGAAGYMIWRRKRLKAQSPHTPTPPSTSTQHRAS